MAAPSDTVTQAASGWDEAQCKAALAQLEALQQDLDNIRFTIPRMVHPFNSNLSSPAALFQAFKQATVGSQNDIKSFRVKWQSSEIQSIFDRARESQTTNSDLTASAQVPKYGWLESELAEKAAGKTMKAKTAKMENSNVELTNEYVAQLVDDFKKKNPKSNISIDDNNQVLNISLRAGALVLRFRVVIQREANGWHKLDATCLGKMKLFPAITNCISSRPRANDLKYLLDMIAAYKDTRQAICAKCSRLLDNSALTPAARRSKQVGNANENAQTVWEAFHEGCLGGLYHDQFSCSNSAGSSWCHSPYTSRSA
ncbi:hypothetical protein K469DRAFT_558517 [Zopfia rhizophila CBS 207.26]|uniref:Mediator complex subunit 27 n=1 Tax=Zopfia rhizophila CBS 207.26 TaxID=1314779 RepID=A0A6A6EJB5_9PEZI|nr:hypothetical protein K469DRAFT_558517 [Zopfia rhizophila CBS 207.26]